MEALQKAIEKIKEQQSGENTHSQARMLGNQLIGMLMRCPEAAKVVLTDLEGESMSIQSCAVKLKTHADEIHKKEKRQCRCHIAGRGCENHCGFLRNHRAGKALPCAAGIQSADITKLALLGEVMAPEREEIAKNNNLEDMSVQELKKALAEINGLREQISFLKDAKKSDKDRLAETQEQLQKVREELQALKSAPIEIPAAQVDEEAIRAEERKKAEDEKAAIRKAMEQEWAKNEDEKAELKEKHAKELKEVAEKAEEQATARVNMELSIAQQETAAAKKEVERLQKELALKNSQSGAEVNNLFDKLQNIFFAILDAVNQMAQQDAEQAQKLRNATKKALQAMIEQMEELTNE